MPPQKVKQVLDTQEFGRWCQKVFITSKQGGPQTLEPKPDAQGAKTSTPPAFRKIEKTCTIPPPPTFGQGGDDLYYDGELTAYPWSLGGGDSGYGWDLSF